MIPSPKSISSAQLQRTSPHTPNLIVIAAAAFLLALGSVQSLAANAKVAGIDLLKQPLSSAWSYSSEDPKSNLSDVWQVRNDILHCKGSPKGCLYLNNPQTDFILRLEWRWPDGKKPGNAGVLIRTTGPRKIWPRSLEAQLNANQAGDFWGLDGFSFDGPSDRKQSLNHDQFGRLTHLKRTAGLEKKAGQWNQYEILANGSTVILKVNGKEVNRANNCEVIPGSICLTAEGDEIQFRNLRLIPKTKP